MSLKVSEYLGNKTASKKTTKKSIKTPHKKKRVLRIVYCAAPSELQADETLNQTNSETDKASDHEQQQKRLPGDSTHKGVNPTNGTSHQRSDGRNNLSHENTPLHPNETLDQTNTETDKANDHKHEDQRIISNDIDKGADPGYDSGDDFTNITNNSSKSTSSRSRRR